ATDLVRRGVSVIATFGNIQTALAAKSATTDIPIVFMTGAEPLRHGLVTSFNRPGSNITGVTLAVAVLGAKRLGVLREAVPKGAVIGLLVNPTNVNAELNVKDALAAVKALGQKLVVVKASADRDFEAAFAALSQETVGALSIDPDALFLDWREQIVALAA